MEELFKEHYLIIIICLSVISLLLFAIVCIDQFDIKKRMAKEIKELRSQLNNLNSDKGYANQKTQSGTQRQVTPQQKVSQLRDNQAPNAGSSISVNTERRIHSTFQSGNTAEASNFAVAQEHKQKAKNYHYLQDANGGKFIKLMQMPDKCFFRTWEEDGIRKYEFHGNVAKALANINAIFDDVCEIEGKRSGATEIENIKEGILDSDLRITRKAKIRLK